MMFMLNEEIQQAHGELPVNTNQLLCPALQRLTGLETMTTGFKGISHFTDHAASTDLLPDYPGCLLYST
jgi:hypothetical protein